MIVRIGAPGGRLSSGVQEFTDNKLYAYTIISFNSKNLKARTLELPASS